MNKTKTYMDKLMENKEFRERFDEEYQNICIGEQIAKIRHQANLTQDALATRIHTTKSAISRYENFNYKNYSIALLNRIAEACGVFLKINFVTKGTKKIRCRNLLKYWPLLKFILICFRKMLLENYLNKW